LASRQRDPQQRSDWLRSVFLAFLVITSVMSVIKTASAASSGQLRRAQPVRFSELAELTPANVHGLLPLVSRDIAAQHDEKDDPESAAPQQQRLAHRLQLDSLAGADLSMQRFLDERIDLQLALEEPPGAHQLRAWDPSEQRVIWSVTEALPISAHTLITAGGLIFYATTDGWLKALDARNGRTVWKHRAQGRELDQPFSYRGPDGHQYIGVHSLPHAPGGGREELLIFALAH